MVTSSFACSTSRAVAALLAAAFSSFLQIDLLLGQRRFAGTDLRRIVALCLQLRQQDLLGGVILLDQDLPGFDGVSLFEVAPPQFGPAERRTGSYPHWAA